MGKNNITDPVWCGKRNIFFLDCGVYAPYDKIGDENSRKRKIGEYTSFEPYSLYFKQIVKNSEDEIDFEKPVEKLENERIHAD